MAQDSGPVMVEMVGNRGVVVALVEVGEPVEDVLRRAIHEAATRSGRLEVLQLTDDPSLVRRALAKARLARDVERWSRDVADVSTVVKVVDDASVEETVVRPGGAACLVTDSETLHSPRGLAVLGRRVLGVVGP